MNHRKVWPIVMTLGFLAFGPVHQAGSDEDKITELFVKIVQAWGHKPSSVILSRFSEDISLVDPQRRTLRGVSEIRQAYTELLQRGLLQGSQLTVNLDEFQFKDAGGVATVDGTWAVSWPYAQGRIPKVQGRYSVDLAAAGNNFWRFEAIRLRPLR